MKFIADVTEGCVNCQICVKECDFLQRHGTPGAICKRYLEQDTQQRAVFACNLCGLCTAVCPKELDVPQAFLEIRRAIQEGQGQGGATASVLNEHQQICRYEKLGASSLFSLYQFPEGCDTIFFPGCTLAATRSKVTLKTYSHLQTVYENCGFVLDCCLKPSHDVGLSRRFEKSFSILAEKLGSAGIKKIITACPSCYVTFRQYLPDCNITTVYEELAANPPLITVDCGESVVIHDTCTTRNFSAIHDSVRSLLVKTGVKIEETEHSREKTLCCGEGAAAAFVAPGMTGTWKSLRQKEAENIRVITYCAGCSSTFDNEIHATHLLDLLFDRENALTGKEQKTRSPFTYFSRLLLKWRIRRMHRPDTRATRATGAGKRLRLSLLVLLLSLAAVVQLSGVADLFSKEGLSELVLRFQHCSPIFYIAVFTLAPTLFIPASPFVILAGLLYGPYWGLVYAMAGATGAASLSFLVSRYLGAEYIRRRLSGGRWDNFHENVERHGWKMVAFARLVPLFPFALVNFAFGVTRVKFSHYVLTTGICMVPACFAFVLFSSSLADVLQGHISSNLLAGLGLVLVVCAVPVVFKQFSIRGRL